VSTSLDRDAGAFVRPRYTDADVADPLPLWDRFQEACLESPDPLPFVVRGDRGAGVTTALAYLAARCREAGRTVVELPTPHALEPEVPAGAVLVADLSVTPLDPERHRWFRAQPLPEAWARVPLLIGQNHEGGDWLLLVNDGQPRPALRVELAPWNQDDLIELLGAEPYRERRAELLAWLGALEELAAPLRRPWSARLLIEAMAAVPRGATPTLGEVYANVLDRLFPTSIDVLRALRGGGKLRRRDLASFPLELPVPAAEELSLLMQTPREVAEHMLREDAPTPADGGELGSLALPGLASFVQAGECVRWLVQEQEPPPVRASWVPFFPQLVGPGLLGRLTAWLRDPNPPVRADGALLTILHACGRPLPLGERPLLIEGAVLRGVQAPGADLSKATIKRAALSGAELKGADLRGSSWSECDLSGLQATGALLDGAWWSGCGLNGAVLDKATGRGVRCEVGHLGGSDWSEAKLEDAKFEDCELSRSTWREAFLESCMFAGCNVAEADFSGATLFKGGFLEADLREVEFEGAKFAATTFVRCDLGGARLELRAGTQSTWFECDLGGTDLSGLDLRQAHFGKCRAHAVDFSGCDLREARFEPDVRFELGSTREGMLLGEPASEGTRTGYYAEGTTDEAWSTQPDLPLASFRGADLRGVTFGPSLFRLDLRGATLDPELRERARKEGALLDE